MANRNLKQEIPSEIQASPQVAQRTGAASSEDPNAAQNPSDADKATLRREEHQIMITCLCNKVIMLHANPFLGRIFVYELDPSLIYRFQGQVTFAPLSLVRIQIIDNTLVVHNLDEKSSQIYDFKIADYASPLTSSNLDVDLTFIGKGAYMSDLIFPEEQDNESESAFKGLQGLSEQAMSIFNATSGPNASKDEADAKVVEPMQISQANSKEYVEVNFEVKYTNSDSGPV